jgi:C1A family cysteine protease
MVKFLLISEGFHFQVTNSVEDSINRHHNHLVIKPKENRWRGGKAIAINQKKQLRSCQKIGKTKRLGIGGKKMFTLFAAQAHNPETGETFGTGWVPEPPDMRDYNPKTKDISDLAKKLGFGTKEEGFKAPNSIDLRPYCSPINNQGGLGSCTAQAATGVVEYFEQRAFNKHIDSSPLFVYKATRNLLQVTGDTGAWLRNTMGALSLCGVPHEKYWPYTDQDPDFDEEPSSFVYAVADNYEATKYFCHDPLGQNVPTTTVLNSVKNYLAAGIPSMFGFWGFRSFWHQDPPGHIPFPCPNDLYDGWGHALVAVGYDDNKKITNKVCNKTTKGALLIRNSWGPNWGDKGYGWFPYDYVKYRIAVDFWSLISMEWLDTGNFHI